MTTIVDGDSTLGSRYHEGRSFAESVAVAQKNVELWNTVFRLAKVDPSTVARVTALPGAWHLLVLSEDWCGDAVNTVPVIARLAELAPNLDIRILERDRNPDIMDAHLTGISRSIPVVMALDAGFVERAWWGPRPSALQSWYMAEGKLLPPAERYPRIRQWYARDRGRTTVEEVVTMLERAAAAA